MLFLQGFQLLFTWLQLVCRSVPRLSDLPHTKGSALDVDVQSFAVVTEVLFVREDAHASFGSFLYSVPSCFVKSISPTIFNGSILNFRKVSAAY